MMGMSLAEILAELPKFTADERSQILQRLYELEEFDSTAAEKIVLAEALDEFKRDGKVGAPWREVIERLGSSDTLRGVCL